MIDLLTHRRLIMATLAEVFECLENGGRAWTYGTKGVGLKLGDYKCLYFSTGGRYTVDKNDLTRSNWYIEPKNTEPKNTEYKDIPIDVEQGCLHAEINFIEYILTGLPDRLDFIGFVYEIGNKEVITSLSRIWSNGKDWREFKFLDAEILIPKFVRIRA